MQKWNAKNKLHAILSRVKQQVKMYGYHEYEVMIKVEIWGKGNYFDTLLFSTAQNNTKLYSDRRKSQWFLWAPENITPMSAAVFEKSENKEEKYQCEGYRWTTVTSPFVKIVKEQLDMGKRMIELEMHQTQFTQEEIPAATAA